jgi:hypothetical protein
MLWFLIGLGLVAILGFLGFIGYLTVYSATLLDE